MDERTGIWVRRSHSLRLRITLLLKPVLKAENAEMVGGHWVARIRVFRGGGRCNVDVGSRGSSVERTENGTWSRREWGKRIFRREESCRGQDGRTCRCGLLEFNKTLSGRDDGTSVSETQTLKGRKAPTTLFGTLQTLCGTLLR